MPPGILHQHKIHSRLWGCRVHFHSLTRCSVERPILILLRLLDVLLSATDLVGGFVCSSLVAIGFSSSQQLVRDDISLGHDEGSGNGARRSQEDNNEGGREIWQERSGARKIGKGLRLKMLPAGGLGQFLFFMEGKSKEGQGSTVAPGLLACASWLVVELACPGAGVRGNLSVASTINLALNRRGLIHFFKRPPFPKSLLPTAIQVLPTLWTTLQ